MANARLIKLMLLFEPENSSDSIESNNFSSKSFHQVTKQSAISVKALVWIIISIVLGIGIGQL